MLGLHPVMHVPEGELGLLDAEPDVHEVGVNVIAAQVLVERGEEAIAVFLQQGLQGFQLLAPPFDRPGGSGMEVLALTGNQVCVISAAMAPYRRWRHVAGPGGFLLHHCPLLLVGFIRCGRTPLAVGVQATVCTSIPPPRRITCDLMLVLGGSAVA
jgi:hypothetical protein